MIKFMAKSLLHVWIDQEDSRCKRTVWTQELFSFFSKWSSWKFCLFHFIKTVLVQGRHRLTCWAGVTFGGSKSGSHFVFQINWKICFLKLSHTICEIWKKRANYVRVLLAEHNIPFSFLNEINITIVLNILSQNVHFFFKENTISCIGSRDIGCVLMTL